MKALWCKGGGKILLGDNTEDGAAFLRRCWSLHFNWTPLYKHKKLTMSVRNTDAYITWQAPDLPERNYCFKVPIHVQFLFRQKSHNYLPEGQFSPQTERSSDGRNTLVACLCWEVCVWASILRRTSDDELNQTFSLDRKLPSVRIDFQV
jgi:hypothetical protein